MYKQDPEQVTVKFIVLGNQGVGKTSFLSHACPDSFKPDLSHKIGIDFMTTRLILDEIPIRLNIWDSCSMNHITSIFPQFYRGSDAVFFLFRTTDSKSLISIDQWWIGEKRKYNHSYEMLLENTVDRQREFPIEDVELVALKHGVEWRELNAKTGEGVKDIIQQVVRETLKRRGICCQDGEKKDELKEGTKLQVRSKCF